MIICTIRRLSVLHNYKIWSKTVNYYQNVSIISHAASISTNYRKYNSIISKNPTPVPQSITRWIRSLIFFWVNKQSHNLKVRDVHSIDNLNELCLYLSNTQSKDSIDNIYIKSYMKERLLEQKFDTLYHLHKLLVRNIEEVSIKHLVITLNSYTRLKSLFPKHINQIYTISEELVDYLTKILTYNVQFVNVNEQDVSLLLNGMSKLNIRHKVLLKLLENLLIKQIEDKKIFLETFSPQGISLVMNAFQKFDWIPSPYLLIITSQFTNNNVKKFTLPQLLITCHALWKLQLNNSYIIPLLKHLDKMMVNGNKIDLKILSISLYTFGKMEYFPELSKDIIIRELSKELNGNLDIYGIERENLLTNVIYGLSQLNWRLNEFMDKLFDVITEMKLSTIGLATTIVSFCKLDYKPLILAIRHFNIGMKDEICNKYYKFLLLLFQRIKFTIQLSKTPEFTTKSSPSLITGKQLLNTLFTFVLSDNNNLELYNYILSNSTLLVTPNNLNHKGITQLTSIIPFFLMDDSILSRLNIESLRYLNQTIDMINKNETNNEKTAIKSSKTHLSIASSTRKVVKQLYNEANVFVEYKNVPYTIDIVVK